MAFVGLLLVIMFKSGALKDPCSHPGKLQPTLIVGRSEKLFIDTESNMMYICSKTSVSCSTEARQNFSGNLTENVKPHISRFWIAGDVDIFGKVILKGVRAFSLQSCNGSILINSSYPIKGSCNQASATKGRCLGGAVGKCGQLGIGAGGAGGGGHGGHGGQCKDNPSQDGHINHYNASGLRGGKAGRVRDCWYKSIGGGAIRLLAKNGVIRIESQIDVSSTNKRDGNCAGNSFGGGGGGGTIRLKASKICLVGEKILKANGGEGFGGRGGGGGGGIIQIVGIESVNVHKNAIVVEGGSRNTDNCERGSPGHIRIRVKDLVNNITGNSPPQERWYISENNTGVEKKDPATFPSFELMCSTRIREFEPDEPSCPSDLDLIARVGTISNLAEFVVTLRSAKLFTRKIRELTASKNLTVNDIILTTYILEKITGVQPVFTQVNDFTATVSNVLDTNGSVWDEINRRGNTSIRIIDSLNIFLGNVSLNESAPVLITTKLITAHITEINSSKGLTASSGAENRMTAIVNSTSGSANASFAFPNSTNFLEGLSRIIFIFYGTSKHFQNIKVGSRRAVLSDNIVAVNVKGQKMKDLAKPVEIKIRLSSRDGSNKVTCVFWNAGKTMKWSTEGCRYRGKDDHGREVCLCDHLTNFALLMDMLADESTDDEVLSKITYVGGSISIAGLLVTMATIILYNDLRRKLHSQILFNICFSLLITFSAFLISAKRRNTISLHHCRAVAILLHYSVLGTFAWICIDSYSMYLAFVKVIPKKAMEHRLPSIYLCCIIAWGIPALIVGSTTAWALDYYGNDQFCILSGVAFFGTFVGPVVLTILINFISFVLIMHGLLKSGQGITASRKATGLQKIRRITCIFFTLGLTWVFGVLAVKSVKEIFQYLFCILNSLQGFLIFLFYCALSPDVRGKYRTSWNKSRRNGSKHRSPSNIPRCKSNEYRSSTVEMRQTNTNAGSQAVTKHGRQTATEIGVETSNQLGRASDNPGSKWREKRQKNDYLVTGISLSPGKCMESKALI